MEKKIIYNKIEEIVYIFDEKDIMDACKSRIKEVKTNNSLCRRLYDNCGKRKGVEIRVLLHKGIDPEKCEM